MLGADLFRNCFFDNFCSSTLSTFSNAASIIVLFPGVPGVLLRLLFFFRRLTSGLWSSASKDDVGVGSILSAVAGSVIGSVVDSVLQMTSSSEWLEVVTLGNVSMSGLEGGDSALE